MRTPLVITDLTRMHGQRVCIAGYDPTGHCVRPVQPSPGILEDSLWDRQQQPLIFPFAIVEFDLQARTPQPPHTEDQHYDPTSLRLLGTLHENARRGYLTHLAFPGIQAIYETPILTGPGYYVMDGQGPRSLGTIRPGQVICATYQLKADGSSQARIHFLDEMREEFTLTITDLTWRYFVDYQRNANDCTVAQLAQQMTTLLQTRQVYLRIGLARGWSEYPDRCYLQVTGIFTFPDYLGGLTLKDLL